MLDDTGARANVEAAAAAAAAIAANNVLSRFDSSLGLLTRKFTNLIQVSWSLHCMVSFRFVSCANIVTRHSADQLVKRPQFPVPSISTKRRSSFKYRNDVSMTLQMYWKESD